MIDSLQCVKQVQHVEEFPHSQILFNVSDLVKLYSDNLIENYKYKNGRYKKIMDLSEL